MLCGISPGFPGLFPTRWQVIHVLLTRSPLYSPVLLPAFSFDLHVLGTPPALILSQDQTLMLTRWNPQTLAGRNSENMRRSARRSLARISFAFLHVQPDCQRTIALKRHSSYDEKPLLSREPRSPSRAAIPLDAATAVWMLPG
jgi:hypothetical protein